MSPGRPVPTKPAANPRWHRRMKGLLNRTDEIAHGCLETLDDRSVAPSAAAFEGLRELSEYIRSQPSEPRPVLETLDRPGSPATMGMAGRRFSQ